VLTVAETRGQVDPASVADRGVTRPAGVIVGEDEEQVENQRVVDLLGDDGE
jgi:hypothetical protein